MHSKGTMPYFLKGLPSTQAETHRHSYNTRVVTEKRLTDCHTTKSRYLHALYLCYGASIIAGPKQKTMAENNLQNLHYPHVYESLALSVNISATKSAYGCASAHFHLYQTPASIKNGWLF